MNNLVKKRKTIISVIIVNYNTGNILRNCVESLYKFEKENTFEVIIVDQNSSDNSKEIIKGLSENHSFVKSVFNNSLNSFSGANNQGFDISSGEYILIMNPDIIFTESLFDKLLKIFDEHSDIGALCPLLVGKKGNFQEMYFQRYPALMQFLLFYTIWAKTFLKSVKLRNKYLENRNILSDKRDLISIEQIPCAFFFTKRDIFESCGKMDENYVLFFEDVDLSFQINKHYKLAIDTSCSVMHLGGESFKTVDNWRLYGRFIKSMHYFFKKNKNPVSSFLLYLFAVINSCVIVIFEYAKSLFRKSENYRLKKHQYLLKLFIPFLDKK
jgi:GT2 family glycosyltransferase